MKKGFTLIELLIVVAIIAILAAIAIPNFLQAQVRSKVSRVVADMRSIATALEAYMVDHNTYPPDGYQSASHPRVPEGSGHWYLNNSITTPIAYLTTASIVDAFSTGRATPTQPWLDNFRYANYYWSLVGYWRNFGAEPLSEAGYNRYARIYGQWALFSRGPDQFFQFGSKMLADSIGLLWSSAVPYDPTNGVVSIGDITRSQMGFDPNYGAVDWNIVDSQP